MTYMGKESKQGVEIHFGVHLKLTQHCKSAILSKNYFLKNFKKWLIPHPPNLMETINPQIQEVQWILNEHRKYDENYIV